MAFPTGSPIKPAKGGSIGLKAPAPKPNNLTATASHKAPKGAFRDMKY